MEGLFALLSFICFVAIPVGLMHPEWVIRWGQEKTKEKVVRYYGVGLWASLTLGFAFSREFTLIEALGANTMIASAIALFVGRRNPEMVIGWGPKEARTPKNVSVYYGTALAGSVVLIMISTLIQPIFELIGSIAILGFLVAFIVGMIQPNKLPVLDPFEKRTRKAVAKYYGVGFLVACLIPWGPAINAVETQVPTEQTQNIESTVIENDHIPVIEENKEEVNQAQTDEAPINEVVVNEEATEEQNTITNEVPEVEVEANLEHTQDKDEQVSSQKVEETTQETVEDTSSQVKEETGMVYWVPSGKVYHSTKSCSALSRSKTIYSGTIAESGKSKHCQRC